MSTVADVYQFDIQLTIFAGNKCMLKLIAVWKLIVYSYA